MAVVACAIGLVSTTANAQPPPDAQTAIAPTATAPDRVEPTTAASEGPSVAQTALAGAWRLRIELGNVVEFRHGNDALRVGYGFLASVDVLPILSLELGQTRFGSVLGARLQAMTDRGWQWWGDAMAGWKGYSSIEGAMLTFGGAVGVSMRVNDRFLLGPYVRYMHEKRTRARDEDFLAIGVQFDLVIARRHARPTSAE